MHAYIVCTAHRSAMLEITLELISTVVIIIIANLYNFTINF